MNSNIPQVSVIIPLYNKAPYIKRALDSVLAQTVQDFEIVVVNDGSKDGGEKIVEEYADTRIRLINQENQGVSAARNHGVDAARSELVAFLDADDEWLPEFLETIFRLRRKWPEAGLYGTGYKAIDASERAIAKSSPSLTGKIDNYFQVMNHHKGMLILTSAMAIPKEVYLSFGGFPINYKFCEDKALRGKIALFHHVAYDAKVCARYYTEIENSAVASITYFLRDPLADYISYLSISKRETLMSNTQWKDFKLFIDKSVIGMVIRNIYSHQNKQEIQLMLKFVSSKECWSRLIYCNILLHLPYWSICCIIKLQREIKYVYHLINYSP